MFFILLPGPIVGGAEAAAASLFRAMTGDGRRALPEGYRLLRYDTIGSTNDEAKAPGARRRRRRHAGLGRRADRRARPARPRLAVAAGQSLSVADPAARRARRHAPRSSALSRRSALGEALGAAVRAGPASCATNGRTTCSPTAAKIAGILLESEIGDERTARFRRDRRRRQSRVGAAATSNFRRPRWPSKACRRHSGGAAAKRLSAHFDGLGASAGATEGFAPIRAAWLAPRQPASGEPIRVRLERATLVRPVPRSRSRTARCCSTPAARAAAASPPAKSSRRSG